MFTIKYQDSDLLYYYEFYKTLSSDKLYLGYCGTSNQEREYYIETLEYVGGGCFVSDKHRSTYELHNFHSEWQPAMVALMNNKPFDDVKLVYE